MLTYLISVGYEISVPNDIVSTVTTEVGLYVNNSLKAESTSQQRYSSAS